MRFCVLLLALCFVGCKASEVAAPATSPPPRRGSTPLTLAVDLQSSLRFKAKLVSPTVSKPGWEIWDCSYTNRGTTETFRIETKLGKGRGPRRGTGILKPLGAKPCENLLRDLKPVLGGTTQRSNPKKKPEIQFDLLVYGVKMDRRSDGSFGNEPNGSWTSLRAGIGPNRREVYINLNSQEGVGEFGLKDVTWGTEILREFTAVLG